MTERRTRSIRRIRENLGSIRDTTPNPTVGTGSGGPLTDDKHSTRRAATVRSVRSQTVSQRPASSRGLRNQHGINGPDNGVNLRFAKWRGVNSSTFRINQRVNVQGYGKGTIQFIGTVDFAQGLYFGISLDDAIGKHDGCKNGRRYFTSKDNHGILVKSKRIESLSNENDSSDANMNNKMETINTIDNNKNDLNDSDFIKSSLKQRSLTPVSPVHGMNGMHGREEMKDNDLLEYENENENQQWLNRKLNLLKSEFKRKESENARLRDDISLMREEIEIMTSKNEMLSNERTEYEFAIETKCDQLESEVKQLVDEMNKKDERLKKQKSIMDNKLNKIKQIELENQEIIEKLLYANEDSKISSSNSALNPKNTQNDGDNHNEMENGYNDDDSDNDALIDKYTALHHESNKELNEWLAKVQPMIRQWKRNQRQQTIVSWIFNQNVNDATI